MIAFSTALLDMLFDPWVWLIRHYPVSFPLALGYIGYLVGVARTERRYRKEARVTPVSR